MGLSTFLKNISSIASVLPTPVSGFVTLVQVRSALQAGAAERAFILVEKGISDLNEKMRATDVPVAAGQYANALRAGLTALLAVALRRLGNDASAHETYQAADVAFSTLIRDDAARTIPFLSDYLLMLAEFEATEKALDVAAYLSNAAQAATEKEKGGPAFWLNRLTLSSSTVRMIMDLGRLLAPDNPEGAFEAFEHAAGVAVANNDPAMASEAIGKALEIHPADGGALRIRGLLRWRAGEIRGAAEDFAAAVASNSEDMESRVALARAALELNDPQQAAKQLSIVLSKQPAHSDALWLRGMAELRIGEAEASQGNQDGAQAHWEAAIESFTAALEQKPKHSACRRSRAIAYHLLGKFPEALEDLDIALRSDPDDVDGHGWRGVVLSALGRYDETLAAVNVALALIGSSTTLQSKRAWLLGIRGRALLATNWPDQAIEVLKEAVVLDPRNEDMARGMLEAYAAKRDWPGLAQCARDLQNNGAVSSQFLMNLRELEITALRNARKYEDGFAAFDREPRPQADDPEILWLWARLLADIGDFEQAHDALPEAGKDTPGAVDRLSLRGWVVQNLEPRDLEERTELGKEGYRLYDAALDLAKLQSQNKTQGIWLRKGRANASLRSGAKEQAYQMYDEIIEECEQTLREYKPNSRIMALAGWCYHCREDQAMASRCYEDALNSGDPTIAIELDYCLVLTAAALPVTAQGTASALDRYRSVVARAEKEHVLRRIGLLRVAFHDLRELSFRKPDLPQAAAIRELLGSALRAAMDNASGAPAGFTDHLRAFLAVVDAATWEPDVAVS